MDSLRTRIQDLQNVRLLLSRVTSVSPWLLYTVIGLSSAKWCWRYRIRQRIIIIILACDVIIETLMKWSLLIRFCTALRITWSRSCIRRLSQRTHGCCKWRRWKQSITSSTSAALTSPISVSLPKCGVRSVTWRTWGGRWRRAQWVKSFSCDGSLILSNLLMQLRSFSVASRQFYR